LLQGYKFAQFSALQSHVWSVEKPPLISKVVFLVSKCGVTMEKKAIQTKRLKAMVADDLLL